MEIPCTLQTKHISFENPSAIQSEGDVDAKPPRPSHEETKREAMNESPTVHPDEQTSKSETQATGEQVENSRYRLRKPFTLVESPHWLPKGWLTELRVRKAGFSAGNADKFYYDTVNGRQFRSKKEVLFEFLETGKRRKRRPKTTAEEEEAEDETNGLSGTASAFYSGTSIIGGISLGAGKRYKGRPKLNPQREIGDETKDLSGTTSESCSGTSKIGGFFLETEKQSERSPKRIWK